MQSACYFTAILIKLEFSQISVKKTPVRSIMKIRPTEAELFHAYRHEQKTKLTVIFFRKFENVPEEPKNMRRKLDVLSKCRYLVTWLRLISARKYLFKRVPKNHTSSDCPRRVQLKCDGTR